MRRAGAVPALALVVVLAHLATNLLSPYGVHRDEFLYVAMGEHLRLWAMDFPPAIAILARLERGFFGDSLVALRLVPALAAGALVLLAGRLARLFGGAERDTRGAALLAALAVALSPLFLRAGNLFQPVILDQLTWTLALAALARLVALDETGTASATRRWWLALGAALGLGLLVKFSIAFVALPLVVAVGLTPLRRALLTPWPWLALLVALALGSPSIVGQVRLGFPVLGQMHDLQSAQLEHVSPLGFLLGQLLYGPATLLGLVGLGALLVSPALDRWRAVGLTILGSFVLLLALHGKAYYVGPVYPTLFAAGAVALARARTVAPRAGRVLQGVAAALIVGYGLLTLPLGLPIVPPAAMARYATALGMQAALRDNQGELGRLPQDYADMLGWEAQVAAVARVWDALPAGDRARAVLIAGNYGEAGALDYFGGRFGLPRAICACGSYWFFGPGDRPGDVAVVLGAEPADLAPFFAETTVAARVDDSWAVERHVPIVVAR
ncbi:MAG TPA: glycosyltransferase family 39 protein, partial [Gemmatimonadales bacterium]|nr:glycosyltransferase family 39 protein [Gemmatimonadales bacterium]